MTLLHQWPPKIAFWNITYKRQPTLWREMQKQPSSNFIEISLRHGCSPVNLLHIFRTPFPKNTSGRLLLKMWSFAIELCELKNKILKLYFFQFQGVNLWKKSFISGMVSNGNFVVNSLMFCFAAKIWEMVLPNINNLILMWIQK